MFAFTSMIFRFVLVASIINMFPFGLGSRAYGESTGTDCVVGNLQKLRPVSQVPPATPAERVASLEKLRSAYGQQVTGRLGRVHFHVGLLTNKDPNAIALEEAIRKGAIDEINAGAVIGPKVPGILVRLSSRVPDGHRMIVRGYLSPKYLRSKLMDLRQIGMATDADVTKFEQAMKTLKVPDACEEIFRTTIDACDEMDFVFDARYPDQVRWIRPWGKFRSYFKHVF